MSNLSSKGWNWGELELNESSLDFKVDKKLGFSVNYREIVNCSSAGKNEVIFELHQPETNEDDILCEMRIHVPDEETYEMIAKEISERTDHMGQEAVVTLYDLPMLVPRGKYSLDMFMAFMRMHGKTHNYKILYKNITKVFLLPKPDSVHVNMVLALDIPIRQGNTHYPFIILQFSKEAEESVSINLSPENILQHLGEDISKVMEGKSFDIMSKLIKAFTKNPIIIPGNFRSKNDSSCIKCSLRASEGFLYPLQKSFIFIPKPVIYVKFEDIKFAEFARIAEDSITTNRSFDISLITKNGNFQFTGVDREEYSLLVEFLVKKKISIRKTEEEEEVKEKVFEHMDVDDEEDESFNESESDN